MTATETSPPADGASPIPASSVILLRETAERGLETLMLRRGQARFAAFVWVFPGGGVEPQDVDPELAELSVGVSPESAHGRIGGSGRRGPLTPAESFGHYVAAARELFEEVGVALIYGPDGELLRLDGALAAERWARHRQALLSGGLTIARVLREERARLALDRLTYYSHWITPRFSPRRFNTHFFLATLPPHQSDEHHVAEAEESRWVRPGEALALHARGEFPLIMVTRAHLERLARYGTIPALLRHAAEKATPPVEPVAGTDRPGIRERLTPEVAECW